MSQAQGVDSTAFNMDRIFSVDELKQDFGMLREEAPGTVSGCLNWR